MGAYFTARQIVRWTVTSDASPSLSHIKFGRYQILHLHPVYFMRHSCSSSSSQSIHHSAQVNHDKAAPVQKRPDTVLSLQSLVQMGFDEAQAEHIYSTVAKTRGISAKHAPSTLSALFELNLNPSSILKLLDKCPEVYTVNEAHIQKRINKLRKLGFVEGGIQRVVAHFPRILTVPVKKIENVELILREKCLFTTQQITDIFRDCPSVVLEDHYQLEYKFQYVYFKMGVKQPEMVKSKLFRFTLDEVRRRHAFLERRGMYYTPDKKGHTVIINPKLHSILHADQDTFVSKVAKASAEEYDVFQRLLVRECREQMQNHGGTYTASDEEEEEEDDYDDDDDTGGKSGYMKRRKK
ncbi:transcription termination factor 4, mitochondrial [Thalassophryne amazonica]|uniref:transcription termination factor 4, mitochondrial n=1 Tax=Thalassophryne amazonica TaxID=390379 RepID=UPI001471577E|nr:transcription termination factor 4, mitochondrial [Thalassophryne amazonica]